MNLAMRKIVEEIRLAFVPPNQKLLVNAALIS
jgi:hypothetical protein